MTEFEARVLADLSVLKNQMCTLLGDGNSGRIAAIEGRVEQHERSFQRAKGFAVAMSALFTLVQCVLELLWRR
ncbi:MAG: hypothetical protein WBD10_01755 [Acidobacteriaceae bacterium]